MIITVRIVNKPITTQNFLFSLTIPPSSLPVPKQPLIYFLSLWISLHFLKFYINGTIYVYMTLFEDRVFTAVIILK